MLTDLDTDLRMKPDQLNASYQKQWELFERSRWWPWYEKWGSGFFSSAEGKDAIPPKVLETKRSNRKVGRV